MYGGRAGVVLGETLGRHLFTAESHDRSSFTACLQIRTPGYPPFRRSAMQGFGEDYTGRAATRHWRGTP
jgi:hypothetical protein